MTFASLIFLVLFSPGAQVSLVGSPGKGGLRLADAVQALNKDALKHEIGKARTPLSEAEVVSALRHEPRWLPSEVPPPEVRKAFRQIAESRRLPLNAALSFSGHWQEHSGQRFDLWWLDLTITTEQGYNYVVRIRAEKVRVGPLTEIERRLLESQSLIPDGTSLGPSEGPGIQSDEEPG